jgi:hypothetical protein
MVLDGVITNLKKVTWDDFLDYGRSEWQHTLQKIKKKPTDKASLLEAFNKVWVPHHVICARYKHKVRCPLAFLWCTGSPFFGNGFSICVQKKRKTKQN